jgi:capsular exopolysaccharide synthesis family protein
VDGDGKTTLTSNLAISMAQTGRRVLLIDADCRGPMQHKIFSISDKRGLSTVLKGEATFAEVVQKTMVANLDVLSCGEVPTHPAELLDTRTFLDLLKEVSANYDHVLIDSPPVVPIADARILAASCDATILILRAAKSTKGVADHALDILASVGASVVGVVVNDIAANRAARYYQYAYYRSRGDEGNGHGHGFSDHLIDSRVASANVVDAAPLE